MKWFLALLFVATVFGDRHKRNDESVANRSGQNDPFLQLIGSKNPESPATCSFLQFKSTEHLSCPQGWRLYPLTNYCYRAIGRWKYAVAEKECKNNYGSLVLPHSEEENHFVASLIDEDAWLGLQFKGNAFKVKTSDGCASDFHKFDRPEIHSKCFEPFMNREGYWDHTNCSTVDRNEKLAVCKRVPFTGSSKPKCIKPSTCKDGSCRLKCRHGWKRFESHCYKAVDIKPADIHEAKEECAKSGARLASVLSQEENDFLLSMGVFHGRSLLLGAGYDYAKEKFFWRDGCPMYFQNWDRNQEHKEFGEDCIEVNMANGKWNNGICRNRHDDVLQSIPLCKAPAFVVY